ncbi:putative haloalkane dehalogenase [Hyaloraphidium curvatum]|nr:putative haloalkane dehalogenase [Hyaloraphidium curvatum]
MFDEFEYVRTPEVRFEGLVDWPHEPQYLVLGEKSGLRLAYYDLRNDAASAGADAETFLCVHGEPTWSFLYRKMAKVFLAGDAPRRVVCFDWLGFGRSDKPTSRGFYTYERHRETALHLIRHLGLRKTTLVVQDWGSLLGLTFPHAFDRPDTPSDARVFSRLILMNGWLPTGDVDVGSGFMRWRAFAAMTSPDLPVDQIMGRATMEEQGKAEVVRGYAAPFPSVEYKTGPVMFPQLVMTDESYPGVGIAKAAREFYRALPPYAMPTFAAIGRRDFVLGAPNMEYVVETLGKGKGWGVIYIDECNHFVQEDAGEEVAVAALHFFAHLRQKPIPPLPPQIAGSPKGISPIAVTAPGAGVVWKPTVWLPGSWPRFFIEWAKKARDSVVVWIMQLLIALRRWRSSLSS